MSESTAVTVKDAAQLPVSAEQQAQWQEDANQGLENIGAKDIAIPFIGHVQGLSKQLEEGNPKYIPEAKIGTIFNTVTNECFDGKSGILVVVADIQKIVVEKEPKNPNGKGGGKIIMTYATRAEAQAKANPVNELLDGYRLFVLYQTKGGVWTPAAMSMGSKSKIYTMRNWNALLAGYRPNGIKFQPPSFAAISRLTSALQVFDDGTAAVLKAEIVGPTPDDLYKQAKDFRKALQAGAVKLGSDEEGTIKEDDKDLPF